MNAAEVSPRVRRRRVGPTASPTSLGIGPSQELLDKLLENAKHNPETRKFTMSEEVYYELERLLYKLARLGNAGKSPYEMAATYGIPLPPNKIRGGKYKSRRHHKKHHNKRRHTRRS